MGNPALPPVLPAPSHPAWCDPIRRETGCCTPGDGLTFHRSAEQTVTVLCGDTPTELVVTVEHLAVVGLEHTSVVVLRTERAGDALDLAPAAARRLARLLLDAAGICEGVQADWTVTS